MDDLLPQLVLELVAVGGRLGDIVLHEFRLRRARHAPVTAHAQGDADQTLIVLAVGALLQVGAVSGHVEDVFAEEFLLVLLARLQEDAYRDLRQKETHS